MKTIKQTILYAMLAVITLAGCKKYEEGPAFSLRSKTERVSNLWKIQYAYDRKDSVIITTDYTGETWEFTKDGNFVERDNGTIDKTGTWDFISSKEKIKVGFPLETISYVILKLKENEFWLRDTEKEFHLIPAN